MGAATRQERYRARRDAGRLVLQIEVSEIDVVEMLRGGGFLSGPDPERADIERAVEELLVLLCRLHERRDA